jgi:hypothetical protein
MGLLENSLLGKAARVGVSRQIIALLAELSETNLCRGLQGTRPLPGHQLLQIDKLLNDLIAISGIIHPLQLPVNDIGRLKVLLAKFRDGGLDRLMDREIVEELRERIAEIQAL